MNLNAGAQKITSSKETHYFIIYSICFLSLGLSIASLGPILPFLAENTDVSIGQISFLFTTSSLGYLFGSAGGGRLYDRFNGHRMMAVSLLLMVAAGVLIPLVSWFYLLLIVMFVFGLGQGALDVGGNINLVWVFQSRVGPYMNALHFFFGAGAFLAPIIITNVMTWSGGTLTWPIWILAVLYLPGLVGLLFLPSPKNPEKEHPSDEKNGRNPRLVALIMIVFFLYVGVEGGFGGWIFTYALDSGIANETMAAYMTSIFWGALTLGRLLSIPLAKKLEPGTILIGNFILSILFLGVILIWPTSALAVWIGSAGLGLAMSSVFPTLLSLAETRLKMSGGVTGLFFLGSSLGGIVLPTLLGQVFEFIGAYQIMLTLFVFSGLGFAFLLSVILASNRAGEKIRY